MSVWAIRLANLTSGSEVGPHWASWGRVLRPAPSGWAWTGRSARTSADTEAETQTHKSRWSVSTGDKPHIVCFSCVLHHVACFLFEHNQCGVFPEYEALTKPCLIFLVGSEAHRLLHLSGGVLSFSLEVDGWSVFHDPLHRHLNELVEGVQLLADQTLFIKVGAKRQQRAITTKKAACNLARQTNVATTVSNIQFFSRRFDTE